MNSYIRTDLICENEERLDSIEGTEYSAQKFTVCDVERLKIISPDAASRLGRKTGTYVTLKTKKLTVPGDGENSALAFILSKEIRKLILEACSAESLNEDFSVLIAGLGNVEITSDAIGPKTIERMTVTRHIKALDPCLFSRIGMCSVAAFSVGVLGKTGIESAEILETITKKVLPSAVIIIDALAARSLERLACTIQISDVGITPGGGVGNFRKEISLDTLGVPVISIGVPTVVDSTTLIYDVLKTVGGVSLSNDIAEKLDVSQSFFVSPKESDIIIENAAALISNALAEAFVISDPT